MPPFNTVLIANRGEIALRLMRACREMGIASVAVYSDADADAPHVRYADQAVRIGAPDPADSYLNSDKLIAAARETGAQAVHPGYGFLAENAAFAQAIADAGLTFIGPPPKAIEAMGDKARARALMAGRGVPLIPGYQELEGDAELAEAARKIGFPVLVKAAAGGGGKGMRVVNTTAELEEGVAAARREAQHAFGDDRLIVEKYVANARHIEFQILADSHGTTLHLFERECSVQRRHQKIIEETPSPLLDAELRAVMGAAAVAAAQAVDYVNAGTVEFIVDPETRDFYFLEMNTRLQVEHPITELVTGLDLAQWQLRIAAGEALPLAQDQLSQRGHAIECRLYAEDPANQFFPASGSLLRFDPAEAPGVRVDSGVRSGMIIGTHYDPLLAKLIVYAEDRATAIQRMDAALCDTIVLGLTTNREFLRDALAHPIFAEGKATTQFVETEFAGWKFDGEVPPAVVIAGALAELYGSQPMGTGAGTQPGNDPYSPWARLTGFRMGEGRR
jgi:acetyl-CoA carboxylase biotin carboxylase subunit